MANVIIDGTTLDLDPESWIVNEGERRGSTHKTVNGSTFFQDFGFDVTDIRIAAKGKLTSLATVQALLATYRKTGYQFRVQDFKGNDLTCIFEPKSKLPLEPIRGSTIGWTYSFSLAVVACTTYLGQALPPTS